MRKLTAMIIYGCLWFGIGTMLFSKGWRLLDGVALMILGMVVGVLKGHFVLRKVADKTMKRWSEERLGLFEVFPVRFFILVGFMMSLGFLLRFVPVAVRGTVDIAVGLALVYGAVTYFRRAYAPVGS